MAYSSSRKKTLIQKAFSHNSKNLGNRVFSGASYTLITIITKSVLSIVSTSILARLLTPTDFGHVAMTVVVMELVAVFSNFGFGSILIQRTKITRLQLDTVFWASAAIGVILSLIVFGLSFFTGYIYHDTESGQILKVMCWVFLIEQLGVIPNSLLNRTLMFKQQFVIQIANLLIRLGVAVVFAHLGYRFWSIVAGGIAASMTGLLMNYIMFPFWPRLRFQYDFIKRTININAAFWLSGLIYYINTNVDLMLVGRISGASVLGHYQNARSLSDEVGGRISLPLQRVLFPAFSSLQKDRSRLKIAIVRSSRILALVVLPIGFGMAATAEELVPILYGNQWTEMIPMLKLISISAAIRAACAISSPIFNMLLRIDISVPLNIVSVVVFLGLIYFGSQQGVMGIAFAVLLYSFYSFIPLYIAYKLVGLRLVNILATWIPVLLACGLMFWAVTQARGLYLEYATVQRLTLLVFLGASVYLVSLVSSSRQYSADIGWIFSKLRK